jgi:hypothetical protein
MKKLFPASNLTAEIMIDVFVGFLPHLVSLTTYITIDEF